MTWQVWGRVRSKGPSMRAMSNAAHAHGRHLVKISEGTGPGGSH